MDAKTLKTIKRRLNGGAIKGSSARLAAVMGASLPTLRAWMSDPTDRDNYRKMPRSACRLLAAMVLLDAAGLLDDKFIAAVDTAERLLNDGHARLDQIFEALEAASKKNKASDDKKNKL